MQEKRTLMIEPETHFFGAKMRKRKQLNRRSGPNMAKNEEIVVLLLVIVTIIGR